jgi:hypothetical protein
MVWQLSTFSFLSFYKRVSKVNCSLFHSLASDLFEVIGCYLSHKEYRRVIGCRKKIFSVNRKWCFYNHHPVANSCFGYEIHCSCEPVERACSQVEMHLIYSLELVQDTGYTKFLEIIDCVKLTALTGDIDSESWVVHWLQDFLFFTDVPNISVTNWPAK